MSVAMRNYQIRESCAMRRNTIELKVCNHLDVIAFAQVFSQYV